MNEMFKAERKCVEGWLNKLIKQSKALSDIRECPLDEDMCACGLSWHREIQIYKGIEKIALYLQKVITFNPNWSADYPEKGESYFYYKGCKIYQLWTKKEVI